MGLTITRKYLADHRLITNKIPAPVTRPTRNEGIKLCRFQLTYWKRKFHNIKITPYIALHAIAYTVRFHENTINHTTVNSVASCIISS